MIVLDLKLKGIYGFDDFEINFTYPKKLVKSIVGSEHLEGRERFRYKKINVLMGSNATGKTSIGKALLKITNFINDGNDAWLLEMATEEHAEFSVDLVNEGFKMHRLTILRISENLITMKDVLISFANTRMIFREAGLD